MRLVGDRGARRVGHRIAIADRRSHHCRHEPRGDTPPLRRAVINQRPPLRARQTRASVERERQHRSAGPHRIAAHDVARDRGDYESVLGSIRQPSLVVGIDSDVLYPLSEQRELAEHLPRATLEILEAPHGHDSFLIEQEALNDLVAAWRTERDVARSSTAPRG